MERESAQIFENCPFEEGSQMKEVAAPTQSDSAPETKTEAGISVQDQLSNLINGFEYFGVDYKYARDIYSETTLTIHQEKAKCKKAHSDNTFIQKGVGQLLNVVFGDDPHFESKSGVLMGYTKKWAFFSGWMAEMKAGTKQAFITGDGFVRKIKGDKGSFKYKNIENSEDMYIDWDYDLNQPKRYIERVYATQARAEGIKSPEYKTFTLNTPLGTETINGIEYSADEIIHIKFGENVWGIYGRGAPAPALDDIDILNQMERSAAVIARYKAVPKKLLFPDTTADEEVMDDKALAPIKTMLKKMKDFESPIVGQKFSSLNLTDGGQAIDLTPYFDYFKRKISIIVSPEFIAHGELVNRSTSVEQKQMFFLDVCAIRSDFDGIMQSSSHEGVIASLAVLEEKGITIPKVSFKFKWGEYDVELRVEKTDRIQKEWNDGMITLDEYRIQMGYESNEIYGLAFKWEVSSSPEAQIAEGMKKLSGKDKDE